MDQNIVQNIFQNILMIACSETDSNMYYATRFLAPDPFIYLKTDGRSCLLMSDLEMDRALSQAKVDSVLSYSEYERKATRSGPSEFMDVVYDLLREKGVKEATVPASFPLAYGDALRARGVVLSVKQEPFFDERTIKSKEEVDQIRAVQEAVEEAVDATMDLLRNSEVRKGLLYLDGSVLTSESVRCTLHLCLMEKGCVGQHTIVACGVDACDPHNEGSGPLRADEPIIFDVFPKSSESRYYADMSRTVVKGKASDRLKRLYDTVLEGQLLGISRVKNGAHGKEIHGEIMTLFESRGYKTGKVAGRMQGFFHGTGHGVGLDIHEPPRISKSDWILKSGEVVTVEPGLYYPDIGAVRIEDMVWVGETGCTNLTTYHKTLEI